MSLPAPYYCRDGITIYCADCREILPELSSLDCCICDPVWPNATASLAGSDHPAALFAEGAVHFPRLCKRLVVQLGCDSDPRFLLGVPPQMPFFRVCWLPYAVPSYKGRLLYSGDVAYAFGEPPPCRPGRGVIDGECHRDPKGQTRGHPCPRHLGHVRWLLSRFGDGPILDPFAGIGTTLLAAKEQGLPAVGIEIEERYCAVAAQRLSQGVFDFDTPSPPGAEPG